jgi:hypothetical protein
MIGPPQLATPADAGRGASSPVVNSSRHSLEAVVRHEVRFEAWRRVGPKDAYAVSMIWFRDGEDLGEVRAAVSGQVLRAWRKGGGDVERWKQALASWALGQLEAEVKAGRQRAAWAERTFELDVDVLEVQRLATSGTDLQELMEGKIVGSFDIGPWRPDAPRTGEAH